MNPSKPVKPERRLRPELIFSLISLVASLGAVSITGLQTQLMLRQQEASVWPYIELDQSITGDGYTFSLTNKGVGPALIKSVKYDYNGKTYTDVQVLAKAIINDPEFTWEQFGVTNIDRKVMAINERVTVFSVNVTEYDRKNETKVKDYAARMISEARNVNVTIEFESVYGARWANTNNTVVKLR
jgi:hypothetical protein